MPIEIYTTPTCEYCRQLKQYLEELEIEYAEHNVVHDLKRADEMSKKSGQFGVPVVDIDGTIIVGFNKTEIDKALENRTTP